MACIKKRGREPTFVPVEAMFEFGKRGRGWSESALARLSANWPYAAYNNWREGFERVKMAIDTILRE